MKHDYRFYTHLGECRREALKLSKQEIFRHCGNGIGNEYFLRREDTAPTFFIAR